MAYPAHREPRHGAVHDLAALPVHYTTRAVATQRELRARRLVGQVVNTVVGQTLQQIQDHRREQGSTAIVNTTAINDEPVVLDVVPISSLPGAGRPPADVVPVRRARTDLNAIRDRLRDTTAHPYRPGALSAGIVVDPQGNIMLAEAATGLPARRLSQVTSEVFYSPDLNRIAETLRANQAGNATNPTSPSEQLFVDENGNILFGDQVNPNDARRLSKVTQETFYGRNLMAERQTVAAKLPPHAVAASDGEIDGWLYHITNEFGDRYDLFLWYDPASSNYLVSLIEPRLGGTVGVEECHLYQDGTLCLKREGGPGYARLEDAYARSVLWTRGASCYRRGYGFQFNVGQEA